MKSRKKLTGLLFVLAFNFLTGSVQGQNGGVAYFDAPTESYVDLGSTSGSNCFSDLENFNELTVTMWVKWDDKNASNVGNWANRLTYADSSGNGDNGTFWCQHDNNNQYFEFAIETTNGRDYIFSTTQPQEGQWYHVAQVYDGFQMQIFVNGVEENVAYQFGDLNVSQASKLNMGRWPNKANNNRFFDGNMDEISVWNQALSQQEINDIKNNPESVTGSAYDASGLIGYWDFDNYTANDKSPCNNDGNGSGSFTTVPQGSDVTRSTAPGNCNDPANWDNGVPNDTLTAVMEHSMQLNQTTTAKNFILKDSLDKSGDTLILEGDLIHEGTFLTPSGGALEFNGTTTSTRNIEAKSPITIRRMLVNVPSEVKLNSGKLKLKEELRVVSGTLDVGNKEMTLLSDSSGSARIAPLSSNALIKGEVAVQRWIKSGNAGWIDMAAPNRDNVTLAEWDDDIYLSGKSTGGFNDGCSWSGSCFWSVKRSDSTGALVDVTSTSTPLANGRGYELFIGDDGGINTMQSDTTVTVKGRINQPGSFTVDVNDNGWSLVANPFASPIDFDQVSLNNVASYYSAATATGSYESYNRTTGNSTHPHVGNIIASSQGFWLKGNGTNASITFEQSHKATQTASFSKSQDKKPFKVRLTDASNGLSSAVIIEFDGDRSIFESIGHKPTPVLGSPDLHTLTKNGTKVRSKFLKPDSERAIVPLRVVPDEQGTYTFQAKNAEQMPYEKVFLIDSAQGKRHDLTKEMSQVMLSSSDSGTPRFFLEFKEEALGLDARASSSNDVSIRSKGRSILIQAPPKDGSFQVRIYDAKGKKVRPMKQTRFHGGEQRTFEGLTDGIYFVRLTGEAETLTQKVLVREGH